MAQRFPLRLLPGHDLLEAEAGTPLADLLAPHGVEFPCGGQSQCGGCRVRVLEGSLAITPEMRACLSPAEIEAGWRLACYARLEGPLTLEIGQWEMPVLSDDAALVAEPREGFGIAVDVGTTTLVAQLLDLGSGQVLAVATSLNPQTSAGADIMSRVQYALNFEAQAERLTLLLRQGIAALVEELFAGQPAARDAMREVLLAGNTVMHHLFCRLNLEPLAHVPFDPRHLEARTFTPAELRWPLPPSCAVTFLPNLGGFVGSDILAGIVATGMHESAELLALMDLGTNGEIVLGNRQGLECASTAAGPAFEAGRISCGMRAATGAITQARAEDGKLLCHVLGRPPARGICGSGLVDVVAAALELGWVLPSGRIAPPHTRLPLDSSLALTQRDIRELQLAKAAIAAGLRLLLTRRGLSFKDVHKLFLAGAFGNYVNVASGRRIGLLEVSPERVSPSGNTALRGTKMLLLAARRRPQLLNRIRTLSQHIPLASDPRFQDVFVDCMELREASEAPSSSGRN